MAEHAEQPEHSTHRRGAGGEPDGRGSRRRWPAVLGLGVAAALALTSCAGSPGGGTTEDATSPAATEPAEATAGTVPATATAIGTPTAPGDREGTTGGEGATQTHSTEGGYFQWTLPADWTVVEVVDTQRLEGLPVDPGHGQEDVWFRAAILEENGSWGDQGFFDGEDYRLAVQVVGLPEGVNPDSAGDDYWSGWTYVLSPAPGTREGTASFLHGHITQSDAEAITGAEGQDALRAVLESGEYRELRDVATSLEVTTP